ncbi:MAG TPA: FAD-dependent oxidoreductase, partial [Polyangiaceae bacterium]
MLLDANDVPTGETLSADVCIAGAGAAGITLALALRDAGLEVILLESGDFEDDANTQALYRGTMSGIDTWQLDGHRWRLFGGSTSRWAGWCRPMHPFDFERRAYIDKSGWPISYDDLVPFYERAHARVELADFIYDVDRIQAASGRPVLESPGGRLRTEVFQYSPPTRFGQKYRADLQAAENVRVYLHANVGNIDLTSNHAEVRRFECMTL